MTEDRERQLMQACALADARAIVADEFSYQLGAVCGLLAWVILDTQRPIDPPYTWILAVVIGIVAFVLFNHPYQKASDRAWAEYKDFLKS